MGGQKLILLIKLTFHMTKSSSCKAMTGQPTEIALCNCRYSEWLSLGRRSQDWSRGKAQEVGSVLVCRGKGEEERARKASAGVAGETPHTA